MRKKVNPVTKPARDKIRPGPPGFCIFSGESGIISRSVKELMMNNALLAISSVLLLGLSFGCRKDAALPDSEKLRAQVEAQNLAVVKTMWQAWMSGDYDAYRNTLSPDYVWRSPSNLPDPLSREKTIEAGRALRQAFPDAAYSLEEMIASGDKVITRFIMRATHLGEFQGIPATKKKIELSGIAIVRVENGKVVEEREESDMLGLMQTAGEIIQILIRIGRMTVVIPFQRSSCWMAKAVSLWRRRWIMPAGGRRTGRRKPSSAGIPWPPSRSAGRPSATMSVPRS